jgi:glycosyltransferase involved in cell wall biosynthesis
MEIIFINRMMGVKFGGGENADLNFAISLTKRGHDVKIITGRIKNKQPPELGDLNNIQIKYLKTVYLRKYAYKIEKYKFFKKIAPFFYELDLLIFEIKAYKYVKKQLLMPNAFQICALPRLASRLKKLSNTSVNVRWPGRPGKTKLKLLYNYDTNIANGDVFKYLNSIHVSNLKFVNIGVNTSKFYPNKTINNENQIRFLFVGRLIKIKNVPLLINSFKSALQKSDSIRLTIAGFGDKNIIDFIKKEIKDSSSINYIGEIKKDNMPKLYGDHDVFLITSNYDNFPNTVIEAMASGLPVIGTSVGGITDQIINNKTGFLFEKNNGNQLTEYILKLTNNKELINKFGIMARKKILKDFNWDKSASDLEKLYK